jgi:Tfp pilus assembly protein PilV
MGWLELGRAMKRGEAGFSLVELLAALFLLAAGLLSVAPMFVYGARKAASSADYGKVGAAAVGRMEQLRARGFAALTPGGSLTADVASFFDASDPAVTVRWTISDDTSPATAKTINVIAIAKRHVAGPAKQVKLATKRAR